MEGTKNSQNDNGNSFIAHHDIVLTRLVVVVVLQSINLLDCSFRVLSWAAVFGTNYDSGPDGPILLEHESCIHLPIHFVDSILRIRIPTNFDWPWPAIRVCCTTDDFECVPSIRFAWEWE